MQNQKSVASRYQRLRFLPTPRDRHVLEAVRTHGRLTGDQIRRLYFRHPSGRVVSRQAVNTRLRKLAGMKLLEPVVVNGGHGAGPYAYALGDSGRRLLTRMSRTPRGHGIGAVWHLLEIAELRVRVQEELTHRKGEMVEWIGEAALRALLTGRKQWPVPDALVHWRLPDREGTFLLEWDRGTETLAVLTDKLRRYLLFWKARGQRELLPGLGLKPRLVIVVASADRAARLAEWLLKGNGQRAGGTVLIGAAKQVLHDPLGDVWWRNDLKRPGKLIEA